MPPEKKTPVRKPLTAGKQKKRRRKRRGPLIRFRLGRLILIWVGCLICFFAVYMFNRNVHPEKDVFIEQSSNAGDSKPDNQPVDSLPDEDSTASVPDDSADTESSEIVIKTKVNPVPQSSTTQNADYLNSCAFVGETNIYRMGESGLLGTYSFYASEKLTLDNYRTEYVMLDGTTIRVLSAISGAKCAIYLMFGTESLSGQSPEQTVDQFALLLNDVRAAAPGAEIFVLSIPPVTAAAEKGDKPILNSDIDEYNSLLLALANQTNVYFVDTNTALKVMEGKNAGKLDPEHAEEDGIHLTPEASQILLNYVLSHVPSDE